MAAWCKKGGNKNVYAIDGSENIEAFVSIS